MLLLEGYISNFASVMYYFLYVEFSDFYVTQSLTRQTIPVFINRIQHFWVITNLARSVCYRFQSWSSVFISTSYTKSFVWLQK
jgi:hypothetical protein